MASLRRHNANIPILLFAYGKIPTELMQRFSRQNVDVRPRGDYKERLAERMRHGSDALSLYPVMHRLMNLPEVATLDCDQVLFLDPDTFFNDDPNKLFDAYQNADCYAREEPGSRRSPQGYRPTWIDEEALSRVARLEGVSVPKPFGLGVLLFSRRGVEELAQRVDLILDYAWRFLLWMAKNELAYDLTLQQGRGVDYLLGPQGEAKKEEWRRALQYPSGNRWLLEDPSVWLAIGHIPGYRCADLSPIQVVQGGEVRPEDIGPDSQAIICHYFSRHLEWYKPLLRTFVGEDSMWGL